MKCVGAQYLEAIRLLRASGFRPQRTAHVVFVPDEEIGGKAGMHAFVESEAFRELNVRRFVIPSVTSVSFVSCLERVSFVFVVRPVTARVCFPGAGACGCLRVRRLGWSSTRGGPRRGRPSRSSTPSAPRGAPPHLPAHTSHPPPLCSDPSRRAPCFPPVLPSRNRRWFVIKAQGEPGHGSKLYDGSAMERLQVSADRPPPLTTHRRLSPLTTAAAAEVARAASSRGDVPRPAPATGRGRRGRSRGFTLSGSRSTPR